MRRIIVSVIGVVTIVLGVAPHASAATVDSGTQRLGSPAPGAASSNGTYAPSQTSDGRYVIYSDHSQIHLYDSTLHLDRQVSGTGDDTFTGDPGPIGISADGASAAWSRDGFVYRLDVATGAVTRVSTFLIGHPYAMIAGASEDLTKLFIEETRFPVDYRHTWAEYVLDLGTDQATRIDVEADGVTPINGKFEGRMSADGSAVAFVTDDVAVGGGLQSGDLGLFRRDLAGGGITELASWPYEVDLQAVSAHGDVAVVHTGILIAVTPSGQQVVDVDPTGATVQAEVVDVSVSDDGRYVVFLGGVPGNTDPAGWDVYRYDLAAHTSTVIRVGAVLDDVAVSADGSTVAMTTTTTAGGSASDEWQTLQVATFSGGRSTICCTDGNQHRFADVRVDATGSHVVYDDLTPAAPYWRDDAYQWTRSPVRVTANVGVSLPATGAR